MEKKMERCREAGNVPLYCPVHKEAIRGVFVLFMGGQHIYNKWLWGTFFLFSFFRFLLPVAVLVCCIAGQTNKNQNRVNHLLELEQLCSMKTYTSLSVNGRQKRKSWFIEGSARNIRWAADWLLLSHRCSEKHKETNQHFSHGALFFFLTIY